MHTCKDCARCHEDNQPCPRRVANALLGIVQALEKLTEADKAWMAVNSVDVGKLLEDELADRM